MTYEFFLATDTGAPAVDLAPTFLRFKKRGGGAPTNAAPAITQDPDKAGWYLFDYAAAEDVLATVDGGATLTVGRYVPIRLTAEDGDLALISAGVSDVLARLGAFTKAGANTVWGFLRALMSKTAATPTDVGGTFSTATDSGEALSEASAALAAGVPASSLGTQAKADAQAAAEAAIVAKTLPGYAIMGALKVRTPGGDVVQLVVTQQG
jgi:hypothetical protein